MKNYFYDVLCIQFSCLDSYTICKTLPLQFNDDKNCYLKTFNTYQKKNLSIPYPHFLLS